MTRRGEQRAAWRDPDEPTVPNSNDPASVPPATVGENVYNPGDPNGVGVTTSGAPGQPWASIRPSPWSGWPAEWNTPNWFGRVELMTDTAWMCIDLNSSIISSMSPYLVGAVPSLPVDWINNPNPDLYNSWTEFARQLFWDLYLGEAFVVIDARYSNGYPARFHVAPPWTVQADLTGDGLARYRIGSIDVTGDIIHIPYQKRVDEAHGHGPLEAGAARLVAANALSRYASQMAAAGGVPNAVLIHPGNLSATQAEDLQARWVNSRMSSMGLPAVLSGGIDFKTLAFSPKDLALLELAQFNESRIAVLLGVPPFLVGLPTNSDSMTYSNVQQIFEFHHRAGLGPRIDQVMDALSYRLLPRGTTVELNVGEYTKAEPFERAQTWAVLHGIEDPATGERAITVDEIRQIERYSVASPTSNLTSGVLQ